MSNGSYWLRITQERIGRRRALKAAAGLGVGAAALSFIGCGSDGGDGGRDSSGLLHRPVDTTDRAKQGGILKFFSTADIDHFDATISATSQTVALSSEPFYPRMIGLATAKFPKEADGSPKGEVAERWELSGDHLQLTFRIRPGMKWDARPPTNGRTIDAQDVLFSWEKFQRLNNASLALGSVESMTAPDNMTIVAKLKAPDNSILPLFGGRDSFYVQPREADGGFNPRNTVRGHGPWILEEYVPSAYFTWARNPDYYVKGRPFPDKVQVPIVTEVAARLSQFKAGNIHVDVLAASQQDIVPTKRDVPQTLLMQQDRFSASSTNLSTFGWDPGSPWHDKRNRQALSMLIDREAYTNVIFNRDKFAQEGLDVPIRYNSVVPAGWGDDFWLDPTNESKFGPEAKFLRFNIAEAKKLFSAAGHPSGFDLDFYYNGGPEFGAAYARSIELYSGFFAEGGLRVRQRPITPFNKWVQEYSRLYTIAFGTFGTYPGHTGVCFIAERAYSTLPVQIKNQMHKDGQGYRGMVPPGGTVQAGDPKSNDLAERISREFDRQRLISLVHELIRYSTQEMYYVPRVAAEKAFSLWWPAIGNLGVDTTFPNASNWADGRINWWLDTTKPPFV